MVSKSRGCALGDLAVPVSVALVLHDEDEIKAGQDGRLQLNVLASRLHVIIPASSQACLSDRSLCKVPIERIASCRGAVRIWT